MGIVHKLVIIIVNFAEYFGPVNTLKGDDGKLEFVSAFLSLRHIISILTRKILTYIPYPRILKQKYWI